MNGIVVIDKPEGWTSHDVCAKLRGQVGAYLRNREPDQERNERVRSSEQDQPPVKHVHSREPDRSQAERVHSREPDKSQASRKTVRIGHSGTLDPMATGVLPVFIGRATRAVEFCESAEKEYIAGIKFGLVTDTQDVTGNVLSSCETGVTEDELAYILPRFLGEQKQTPPMYSAVKHNGAKLYELARRGVEVERKARDINIKEIELLEATPGEAAAVTHYPAPGVTTDSSPEAEHLKIHSTVRGEAAASEHLLRVVCSKGTYIRTLCNDIGAALGCGAVMSSLRRTRAGSFTIDAAHPLEDVLKAFSGDGASPESILLPVDTVFREYPALAVSSEDAVKIIHGVQVRTRENGSGMYRVYSPEGDFLMLAEAAGGTLKAVKTFYEPEA